MFFIFRKLRSYKYFLFLLFSFPIISQKSISCEAQYLKKEKLFVENKLSKNKELFSDRLNNFYSSVLRKAIEAKVLIVGFFILTFIVMVWLFHQTKSELSPVEDRGGVRC